MRKNLPGAATPHFSPAKGWGFLFVPAPAGTSRDFTGRSSHLPKPSRLPKRLSWGHLSDSPWTRAKTRAMELMVVICKPSKHS